MAQIPDERRAGRKSSPLDDIRPAVWSAAFTTELLELLWTLEATVAIYPGAGGTAERRGRRRLLHRQRTAARSRGMRQPPRLPRAGGRLV